MNITLAHQSLAGRYHIHHALVAGTCISRSTDSWAEAIAAYQTLQGDDGIARASIRDTQFPAQDQSVYLFIRDDEGRREWVTPRIRKNMAAQLDYLPAWRAAA
jgi:hypothetical protein